MSDDDWYPFNPTQHRRETYHLDVTADGIYRSLMDEYFISRSALPDDDEKLASIVRCTAAEFGLYSSVIREFFTSKDGKLYHARCEQWIARFARRPSGEGWKKTRLSIFARDNFICQYCGEQGGRLECDHVIPVSKGGAHDPDNLTTACFNCNRSKRDKLVQEWRQ